MREKKIRVFEAFAGIGAQATALRRLNKNTEVVGISEWYINALLAYDAINSDRSKLIEIPSKNDILKELSKFTFSKDSVHPYDINKLDYNTLKNLYVANKRVKNYGSICDIKGKELPRIDLFIYSFPCQDLSTGGKTLGMKKGSGTRSGLLWEIERILTELKELNKLPEFLVLENVKPLFAPSNSEDLGQWLRFLESIGYHNGERMVLDASDFGVPQDRKRAFLISRLGKDISVLNKLEKKDKSKYKIRDFIKDDYSIKEYKEEADAAQLFITPSREKMYMINHKEIKDGTIVHTITCNMDRNNTSAIFDYKGVKGNTFRLLTIREAFLLMGFDEEEYLKFKELGFHYRPSNKLIGNSIVVNVLEAVFKVIIEEANK